MKTDIGSPDKVNLHSLYDKCGEIDVFPFMTEHLRSFLTGKFDPLTVPSTD